MILIAESGSTKTDWRLLGESTTTLATQTEGINPYFQNIEDIVLILNEQLKPKLVANSILKIFYYGTGITDDAKRNIVSAALKMVFTNLETIEIESDVLAAARGLFGNNAGLAAILGTGSNSCFYDGQKIAFQVPPLGFWLGDEGGGGHLGKTLLLSYLHKELTTDLREKFESNFGVLDRLAILEYAYRKPNPNRYFASFAPFLLENKQDAQVEKLIKDSFRAFFSHYLLKYPTIRQQPVGFVGSIAHHFQKELISVAQDFDVFPVKILKAPMEGLVEYHLV